MRSRNLSVVIPTLEAAATLEAALDSVPGGAEILVVDGGSRDRSREIAAARGARVLTAPAGRALQLGHGAETAAGDVLLFLHADCRLPPDARAEIERILSDPKTVGGWFPLRVLPESPTMRRAAAGSNRRARWLTLPYGDQAIFARRDAFEAVGGFPEDPVMEDAGLARRLRSIGRLLPARSPVTTGPEHWARLGPVATGVLDHLALAAWLLGMPPAWIAPPYHRLTRGG